MTNDNEKNKGTTRAIMHLLINSLLRIPQTAVPQTAVPQTAVRQFLKPNILVSGKMILMDGMKHIRTGKIQKYLKH